MAIHQAAKANDLAAALAAFDQAKADGLHLSADLYVSLLYLCGGGDGWEQHLQRNHAGGAAADAAAAGQGQGDQQQHTQQEQQQEQQREPAGAADGNGTAEAGGAAAAAAAPPAAGQAGGQAAEGSAPAAGAQPAAQQPQPDAAERLRRAEELFAEMKASEGKLTLNEMCFTALARLAAQRGDADRAFELAQARGLAAVPLLEAAPGAASPLPGPLPWLS